MSVRDQVEARLATGWGQVLIMLLLAVGFALLARRSSAHAIWAVLIAMVASWGLGAAYGRRQVYRKVGRAAEGQ